MIKRIRLFLLAVLLQTSALIGFVLLSASTVALAKLGWLLLMVFGLVWVFLKLAKRQRCGEELWFSFGLAALAVCTQQLLGFLAYPGLMKDVEPMTVEHTRQTLVVFAFVALVYLGGYGLLTWGLRFGVFREKTDLKD